MSEVIERLAELTRHRDRDVLDVTLVAALKDLLQPLSVAIYRPVGEPGEQAWLTRARLLAHETTPTADSLWADPAELPRLEDHPLRHDCLARQQAAAHPGPPVTSLFPMSTEHDVVGVLELATEQALSDTEWRLVGSVLRIYRNFQGLLDYSERDTLTGLLNRKTFDESFQRSVMQLQSAGGTGAGEPRRSDGATCKTWLGVIDIDHFKRVNDGFGHLIGDEVLLLLARLMRSSFRLHDQLYRFGGEEFLVMIRCADAVAAAQAFERLRSNVETFGFPRVGRITASVGFTEVRSDDTPSAAFERADKAVYFAKANGRNQVAHHAELVERGQVANTDRSSDVELF